MTDSSDQDQSVPADSVPIRAKGRGAQSAPANRFGQTYAEADLEQVEHDAEYLEDLRNLKTDYLPDASKSIISENDSPDIPFRFSLNPYRGCLHGCSYCYARPTHEYLGLNAGLDFETKIFFKEDAPKLLRDWLNRPGWTGQTIVMSGVTDCYQPVEREMRLTRQCLEVMLEARQPVGIVTKNSLVTRDLDLLGEMARLGIASVAVSLTSLDQELTRVLEPRTAAPAARLRALRELHEAGVPTHVMTAPIIPGLNDSEIPALLKAAAETGVKSAGFQLLRLPLAVKPVFLEWLRRERPSEADRVESRIRATREGKLTASEFGKRMSGTGEIAAQIRQTFEVFSRKFGLVRKPDSLDSSQFRPPKSSSGQLRLF
jgi:DNA repair photolyase